MTSASETSSGTGPGEVSGARAPEDRSALHAGIGCYALWGLISLLFMALDKAGVDSWEIIAERCVWSLAWAMGLVALSRRQGEALAVLRSPRLLAWLALSACLISVNWSIFIYASTTGHKLDASLAYYINPLLNMAAGALLFRERFSRSGAVAIGLALLGVLLQGLAAGHAPWLALMLALTFCGYGVVRKHVPASAPVGLFVECLMLAPLGLAYVLWLGAHGHGRFGETVPATLLILAVGPATVIPLSMFAFAARNLPLSTMGFLQFINPTMTFVIAVMTGEAMTPLRAVSFAFIGAAVAVYSLDVRAAARRPQPVGR